MQLQSGARGKRSLHSVHHGAQGRKLSWGGGGDHPALYPHPPKRLCPEEGPRIAVRRPQHQAVTSVDLGFWAWWTDGQTYFAPGPQCPGLGQPWWGPVAIQHEASGPRTVGRLEEHCPLITEAAAAGYKAC